MNKRVLVVSGSKGVRRAATAAVLAALACGCGSEESSPVEGVEKHALYGGLVVLEHDRRNPPIVVRELPDMTASSDGYLQFAFEIEGEQPVEPDLLKIYADALGDMHRAGWVHLDDEGIEAVPQSLGVEGGRDVLVGVLEHFSTYAVAYVPEPDLAFRFPVGANRRESIAPCGRGSMQYGSRWPGKGYHAGRDYLYCGASMDVGAIGHCRSIFNGTSNMHNFGWYTVEECMLENGRRIHYLSGHRCSTADVGNDGLLAPGQILSEVGNCGFSSPAGVYHVHAEAKLATAASTPDYVGPCFAYCPDNKLDARGYRDPQLLFGVRQPLLPVLYDAPAGAAAEVEARTYLVAGRTFYSRLVLRNPGPPVRFSKYGIGGRGPGQEVGDLFINEPTGGYELPTMALGAGVAASSEDTGGHMLETPGTYQFFAYVEESGEEAASGYPIRVEVVANPSTTVADDADPQAVELSGGIPDSARRGGGYYLDHLRIDGASGHWARWRHLGNPGQYRVRVHIPDDHCAGVVRYGLYPQGQFNQALVSDPFDQAALGPGWRALSFGGSDIVSLEQGAIVDLNPTDAPGSPVCLDAVMFECAGGDCAGAGQSCDGPASQACGDCGMQTRTCDNGAWSPWSACAGQGVCSPGSSQGCGSGGTQTCSASCQWSSCSNQSCAGPASQACGNCGTQTRTCDNGAWSPWSACAGQGVCSPGSSQGCGSGGTQTCSASCQWGQCVPGCSNQYVFSSTRSCGAKYCIEIESVNASATTVAFTKADNTVFGNFELIWVVRSNGSIVAQYPYALCGDSWAGQSKVTQSFSTGLLGLGVGSSVGISGTIYVGPQQYSCGDANDTGTVALSYLCQ